jgi:hypothetical protein
MRGGAGKGGGYIYAGAEMYNVISIVGCHKRGKEVL